MPAGSMAASVQATLQRLEVDAKADARAALALHLASTLDAQPENPAPVARELRMLITELEARNGGPSDDLDALFASMSTPVVDA